MSVHILIIDDDATIRYLINEFVEMAGYHPIVAASAEEAVTLLETQRFDVAISDIMLPGMDGLELTAFIKKNYDTDVIVITGYSGEYSYEEAVDRGASDFVFKPVRFEELLLRLRRVLKERQMKKELHRLAITDGLTKLCNSRHFYKQLRIETERSARYGHPLAILMLDIDYFKNYNDTYGHLEGDKVLSAMGRVIKGCLRATDSAYRYGGEEFIVILPETDSLEAEIVADRIRKTIEQEIFEPKENLTAGITVSIGITEHKPKEELSAFIKRADKAMYESKQKGRNRITILNVEKNSESENQIAPQIDPEFSIRNVSFGFLTHPTQQQIEQIAMLYQLENWWEPTDTHERVSRIIIGSHCFMVASVGDEIIGMGRAISDRANDAYIQDVVLKKEYRGQGFGSRLVEAIVHYLEADGLKWIGLIAGKKFPEFLCSARIQKHEKSGSYGKDGGMKLERITHADYPELKRFFEHQQYRLCVYSLPSLLCWSNEVYQPYAAPLDDDTLLIAAEFDEAHRKDRHLILPVSRNGEVPPEELAKLLKTSGFDSCWFVPEEYIAGYPRISELFEVREQVGYADYLYRKDDLAELKGNKYSKKRNLIHQFQKEYVNTNRIHIEPLTPALCSECLEFLEEWCKEHGCDQETQDDLACEKAAAINMLRHIGEFDVKGLALRIDSRISAYGIGARLTSEIGVFHFEKAFASVKGLYQFFDHLCAGELFKEYAYINKESDMNLEGLAKAKKSYHPAMMVKSYILSLR